MDASEQRRKPLFSRVFGFSYIKSCEKALSLYEIKFYSKIVLERKLKVAKNFSQMSIFPVDVGSLSPSYLLKSPSFDAKMMEINLK